MSFPQDALDLCSLEYEEGGGLVRVIYDRWGNNYTLESIPPGGGGRGVLYAQWLPNEQIEVGLGWIDGDEVEVRRYTSLNEWYFIGTRIRKDR